MKYRLVPSHLHDYAVSAASLWRGRWSKCVDDRERLVRQYEDLLQDLECVRGQLREARRRIERMESDNSIQTICQNH